MAHKFPNIILIVFFIFSCNKYQNEHNGYFLDDEPEFGDRLVVEREDTVFYRYVGSNNEKRVLENGVILKYHLNDGTIDRRFLWGKGNVVGGVIVRYGSDNNFIILEQKSLDDVFGKLENNDDKLLRKKSASTINEMTLMINKCNCSNYWIINFKTDDIYGPFNFKDFEDKRKVLGVSDKLVLEDRLKP